MCSSWFHVGQRPDVFSQNFVFTLIMCCIFLASRIVGPCSLSSLSAPPPTRGGVCVNFYIHVMSVPPATPSRNAFHAHVQRINILHNDLLLDVTLHSVGSIELVSSNRKDPHMVAELPLSDISDDEVGTASAVVATVGEEADLAQGRRESVREALKLRKLRGRNARHKGGNVHVQEATPSLVSDRRARADCGNSGCVARDLSEPLRKRPASQFAWYWCRHCVRLCDSLE